MTHYISKEAALSQIDKLIEKLKDECKPDPLGTTEEMLTAGEIEALDLAKDIINKLDTRKTEDLSSVWHRPEDNPKAQKDKKGRDKHIIVLENDWRVRQTWPILYHKEFAIMWAYVADLLPKDLDYEDKF